MKQSHSLEQIGVGAVRVSVRFSSVSSQISSQSGSM